LNKNTTLLVLDGETRAALAVVRSLGRAGLRVIVASELSHSLAGSSRFCSRIAKYPSPFDNTQLFSNAIHDIIIKENAGVLFPITDATTVAILQHRSLFTGLVTIPIVSNETYWAASDKISLMKTAAQLNIPYPSTIYVDPALGQFPEQYLPTLAFPVILKPKASIWANNNNMRKTGVRFASNKEELVRIVSTDESFAAPYMLQEVITGEGIGIFTFCNKGEVLSIFSHRRIREKPPWGGVSVVCESTQPDPLALEASRKLLKALDWSGVAMVEFKRDIARNNIPVLMEINARFWGSLQLAIDAGVNFPLYQYYLSQNIEAPQVKLFSPARSRWLLGDLDHLIIRSKTPANCSRYPQRWRDKFCAIFTFFLEFLKRSTIEELRYNDIGPFWYAIRNWITDIP
jgi:predicted ATP-grasp superfamily ATP-dependent carboligase